MQRNLWDQIDSNLYDVLGVSEDASRDEIIAAWRSSAKRNHPDVGGDSNAFQRAEVAYQVLSDPLERGRYDRHLRQSTSTQQSHFHARTAPTGSRTANSTSTPGYTYATYDPRTGGYTYSTIYFTTRPRQSAPSQGASRRRLSPWTWFVIVLIALVCIVAAVALTVVSPLIFLALLIWLVGRSLNPRGSRNQ